MGTLENLTRTISVYNLTTAVAPIRKEFARVQTHKDGTATLTSKRVVFPDSITILAGEKLSGLSDGVTSAPEIRAAIARKELRWIPDAAPATPAPVAKKRETEVMEEAPAPTSEDDSKRREKRR